MHGRGEMAHTHKTRNKVRQQSGRKVETMTKNQKPGLYKIQQRFLLIFRPKTKVSLQNPIVSGLAFVNEFEPNF